jgi:cytoplasmic iron level regulating protein YaaA (DUF328/UPF0246 family)
MTLILLPPSETKTGRRRGRPLDLAALSFPALTDTRRAVVEALAKVSASADAYEVLGVPASMQAELERNTRWASEPAVPAAELYTGVLYDALDYASLPPGAKRRAGSRLVITSAAWGALRMADRVPPYRLSGSVSLPGLGPVAGVWRQVLDTELSAHAGEDLIVDCRSSTYVASWRPSGRYAGRWVSVAVVREEAGRRTVVSHMAKHTRGLVARHLLESGKDPRSPQGLATPGLAALADRADPRPHRLDADRRGVSRVISPAAAVPSGGGPRAGLPTRGRPSGAARPVPSRRSRRTSPRTSRSARTCGSGGSGRRPACSPLNGSAAPGTAATARLTSATPEPGRRTRAAVPPGVRARRSRSRGRVAR